MFLPALLLSLKFLSQKIGTNQAMGVSFAVLASLAAYSSSLSAVWATNVGFYEHQIVTMPARNPYFREVAIAYVEMGRHKDAVALIDHNMEAWPTFTGFQYPEVLGLSLTYSKALMDMGELEKAEKYCVKVLKGAPENHGNTDALKGNLATTLMQAKKWDAAYKVLKQLEKREDKLEPGFRSLVHKALATFTVKKK